MQVEETLRNMLSELKGHHRDRCELLNLYITERLNKSLHSYYSELMGTYNMLTRKDAKKVLRKLNSGGEN